MADPFNPRGSPVPSNSYDGWELTHRPAMLPFLAEYTNPLGETSGGWAMPEMVTEPVNALSRLLNTPAAQRSTLHGEREMDWSHWAVEAGIDVGQQAQGLNFSDPGLLLDAACAGLGIALVSQLLSRQARADGLLQPLVEATIRGPNWALLTHRDSENDPMARSFIDWLSANLSLGSNSRENPGA